MSEPHRPTASTRTTKPPGGHALDGLLEAGHLLKGLGRALAPAEARAVDLVAAGQPGDLEITDAGQAEGRLGPGSQGSAEQGHLLDRARERGGLEVVVGHARPLLQAVGHAERDGVAVRAGHAGELLRHGQVPAAEDRGGGLLDAALVGLDRTGDRDDRGQPAIARDPADGIGEELDAPLGVGAKSLARQPQGLGPCDPIEGHLGHPRDTDRRDRHDDDIGAVEGLLEVIGAEEGHTARQWGIRAGVRPARLQGVQEVVVEPGAP